MARNRLRDADAIRDAAIKNPVAGQSGRQPPGLVGLLGSLTSGLLDRVTGG